MDLYAITIKRPDGDGWRYRTMWKFTVSGNRLKKRVQQKLEKSNWELHRFRYERQATSFEEYYETKKYKKVLTNYNQRRYN